MYRGLVVLLLTCVCVLLPAQAWGTTPGFPPQLRIVSATGKDDQGFAGGCAPDVSAAIGGSLVLSVCHDDPFDDRSASEITISRGPFKTTTAIARDDAPMGQPAISPDGRWVAFHVFHGSEPQLELVRVDGTKRHVLVYDHYSPTWSSDGRRLLARNNVTGELDLVDLRGQTKVFAMDTSAVWQPRGKLIAYIGPGGRLIVSRTDRTRRRVFGAAQQDTLAWSPDGHTLAYVSEQTSLQHGLVALDAKSHSTRLLATYASSRPIWAPDGRRLAVLAAPASTTGVGVFTVARTGARASLVAYPGGHSCVPVAWVRGNRIVLQWSS